MTNYRLIDLDLVKRIKIIGMQTAVDPREQILELPERLILDPNLVYPDVAGDFFELAIKSKQFTIQQVLNKILTF